MALDILEVGKGAGELPAVDGLRCLAGVFVRNTEVRTTGARGFGGLEVGGCVSDLCGRERAVLVPVLRGFMGGDRAVGGRAGGHVDIAVLQWLLGSGTYHFGGCCRLMVLVVVVVCRKTLRRSKFSNLPTSWRWWPLPHRGKSAEFRAELSKFQALCDSLELRLQ